MKFLKRITDKLPSPRRRNIQDLQNHNQNTSNSRSVIIPSTWQPPSDINITRTDENGLTDLHKAVLNNNLYLAQHLINLGSDVNAKDVEGQTPLHKAVLQINPEMVNLLIESPYTKLEIKDKEKNTPFDLHFKAREAIDLNIRQATLQQMYSSLFGLGRPIRSTEAELQHYNKQLALDNIMDMLKQPIHDHSKSTKNLYKYVVELSKTKMKPGKIEEKAPALYALNVVLDHQFDVPRKINPNPEKTKKQGKEYLKKPRPSLR